MHAARLQLDVERRVQLRAQRLHQRRAPLAIELAHASDMAAEIALLQEGGDGRLDERRGRWLQQVGDGGTALDEAGRDHEIADAQPGRQHLAEAADEEYALV